MTRNLSRTLFAVTLLLLLAGLFLLSQAGLLRPVENLALRPLVAAQQWISLRFAAVRELVTSPRDIAALRQEIAVLQAENAGLQREIISLREQVAEAEILAILVNYARTQPENRYLAADVIGRDVSPYLRSILIGRGSDDGILRGMPVVTDRGLVGRVVEVFGPSARIQLLTDPASAVNVRLQTSRADAVLAPQLNGELWLDLIPQDAELSVGELVLTSGLGGGYPPDIPVGQVISTRKRDFELFQQAVIQPTVDFERLEIVLVITSFRPLSIEPGNP